MFFLIENREVGGKKRYYWKKIFIIILKERVLKIRKNKKFKILKKGELVYRVCKIKIIFIIF